MSEVKGSLLTIILALTVFGCIFGVVTGAIKSKAVEVSQQISEAGLVEEATPQAAPAGY